MDSKKFKILFDTLTKSHNFEKDFGGWFKTSSECIMVLDLQKSNYGDYYELNIKIFIQGMFGNTYIKNKDLVKKHIGDIYMRQPDSYKNVFDFEKSIEDAERKIKLENLFNEFIVPLSNTALYRTGIKKLAEQGVIFLLPAVNQELLAS